MAKKNLDLGNNIMRLLKKQGKNRLWLSSFFDCDRSRVYRKIKGESKITVDDLQTVSYAMNVEFNIKKNSIEIKEL